MTLKKHFILIIAILLVPIPSLFWIPYDEMIAHGLFYPWPSPDLMWEIATNYLFTWTQYIGLGNTNTEPSGFLYYAYAWLVAAIGGSSHAGQSLILYLGFVGCIGGMFILARTLGFNPIASFIAGVIYLLSPMVMSGIPVEIVNIRLLPFYISTPILFSIAICAIRSPLSKRHLAIFGIASIVLGSAGYPGLQYLVLHLILIITFCIFELINVWPERPARVNVFWQSFRLLVVMFFVNFYWLSSLMFDLSGAYTARTEPGLSDVDILYGLSVKFIDGFRMIPYPYQAVISPWIAFYYTPIITFISFGIVAIMGFAFLSSQTKKVAIYPGLLLVVILFLAKGVKGPLSSIGEFIFLSHPYITRLFRNPSYFEMIAVLAIALLIGLGIGEIIRIAYAKSLKHLNVTIAIVTILIGLYGWQFLIGRPINSQPKDSPSQTVKVPIYFSKLAEFIYNDPDIYRVLSVPTFTPKSSYVAYNWQKLYVGLPILNMWSGKSPLSPVYPGSNGINPLFDSAMHPQSNIISQDAWRTLLRLANVRYVTFHKDTDWKYLGGIDPLISRTKISEFINHSPYLKKVRTFGKIELYEVDPNTFLPLIYSGPTITPIIGDINALAPFTYTSYLGGYLALAFAEQQSKDSLIDLIGSIGSTGSEKRTGIGGQKQRAEKILFANRNFNDLVIDLAYAESKAKGERREAGGERLEVGGERIENQLSIGGQRPLLVKLNDKGKGKFKVKDSGVYEVWIKNGQGFEAGGWRLEVKIDGENLEGREGRGGDKWIKVGEKELEKEFDNRFNWLNWFGWFDWLKGKHRIKVESTRLEVRGNKHKAEELKKLFRDMEIVIVSKDKIKEYEDLLKSKDISYLFYIDKEKIENMLKDKERLEEIKLKGDNPFKIGKQEFYIPKDGSYSVKALIKPKRDFLEGGFVSSSSSSSRASLDALSGWDIKALNTTYKQYISEDGLHIDAYLQNKGDVKEYVVLTKKFPANMSIKESPYLAFSCEMEDLGVQEVEIDVKLTDESEWFSLFRTKKIRLKADNKQYVVNLYQKAKDIFGKKTACNLSINEITLKFKKRDGVDLSREKDRHIYPFKFRAITFPKIPPILIDFKDRLVAYLPDNYYYFDENGGLRSVDFPAQVPWDIKDVYRLHLNRFIDLKETPVLSLNFPKPSMGDWREDWRFFEDEKWRTEFPREWKVLLSLDFDGDEKEDERIIEMFVPAAGMSEWNLLLTVRAYEEVKKRFPDKQNYKLLSIGVSHPDDKEIFYQSVMSKKLIRYREYISAVGGERSEAGGAKIIEVDGKIYKLKAKGERQKGERQKAKGERQKANDDRRDWVEFNNIQLKEGEHSLNVFENDRFKVEMVEIKQVESEKLKVESYETPKVEFKKINPTRYIVDVKGAKGPFTLVFSESFHEGWKGYIRQVQSSKFKVQSEEPWSALLSAWKDTGNRIEIKDHFTVNGYANGWMVPIEKFKVQSSKFKVEDKEEDLKNFQIVLEFKPQRLFEVGLLVSATTLLGCIGYLGYDFRRRRKNKQTNQ